MEKFLKDLTKEAGKILLSFFKKEKDLILVRGTSKEVVTKYDKIVDQFLIKEIERKYPDHSILTEESGFLKKRKDYLWVVDSLDGTSNFANQNPLFSVCTAFMKDKKLVLGAVFAPAIDEFYFAKKGKGAFLNKKRIFVSKIKDLSQCYLLFCDGKEKKRKRVAKVISNVFWRVKDLRKIGSAGIEICWVASSRAEAFFSFQIEPWDVAAGTLILKEAGGKVSDFKGKPWKLKREDFLFSNKKIHDQILKLLNG